MSYIDEYIDIWWGKKNLVDKVTQLEHECGREWSSPLACSLGILHTWIEICLDHWRTKILNKHLETLQSEDLTEWEQKFKHKFWKEIDKTIELINRILEWTERE